MTSHNTRAARRNVVWGMSSLSALVLLFGYHTSTEQASASAAPAVDPATSSAGASSGTASSGTSSSSPSGSSSSSAKASASGSASSAAPTSSAPTTVTGQVAQTRFGPVQVQLTVSGGKVTAVDVLQHPDANGKDQQIAARSLPILVRETLSAQSAKIDMVSGATYTSTGYVTSLQSALDQAGIA